MIQQYIKKTIFLLLLLIITIGFTGCSGCCDGCCDGCCCGCCGNEEDSDGDGTCGGEDDECSGTGCGNGCQEGYQCVDTVCEAAGQYEICGDAVDDDCVDGTAGGFTKRGERKACDADSDTSDDCNFEGVSAPCDCDDNNPEVKPSASEICDGIDNNCNGQIDEGVNSSAPECTRTGGVCGNKKQTCSLAGGWEDCGPNDYGSDFQLKESTCADSKDNDCDGDTDCDDSDCANSPSCT